MMVFKANTPTSYTHTPTYPRVLRLQTVGPSLVQRRDVSRGVHLGPHWAIIISIIMVTNLEILSSCASMRTNERTCTPMRMCAHILTRTHVHTHARMRTHAQKRNLKHKAAEAKRNRAVPCRNITLSSKSQCLRLFCPYECLYSIHFKGSA